MRSPKIAIFLHVFHMELLPSIDKYLSNIPYDFDFYVNFAKTKDNRDHIKKVVDYYSRKFSKRFYYTISSNRGMDPAGFLVSVNYANQLKKKYDYICKVHTKRGSDPNNNFAVKGEKWRDGLLESLFGSPERVEEVINVFKTKPEVGMIACSDYLHGDMGSNKKTYEWLRNKLRLERKKCYPHARNFIAGTMFWVRGEILDFFKPTSRKFSPNMFEKIKKPMAIDGTMAHAFERIFPAIIRSLGYKLFLLPIKKYKSKKPKIISFYFPQYHQMPENDYFWGEGFTEWKNLKNAKPMFPGHKMIHPHPKLGYYNLLSPKIRKMQGELAKDHGIYGFCFHHYWFSGRKVMHQPLEAMIDDGYPDLPFCLNWANEPWTKNWDGLEDEILMPQRYGDVRDWDKHFFYLLNFFKHDKYIKINNKPVFLLYRTGHIKNLKEMVTWWNTRAKEHGFDGMYIIQCLGSFSDSNRYADCVDAVCEFQPNFAGVQAQDQRLNPLIHRKKSYILTDIEAQYQAMTFEKGLQTKAARKDYIGRSFRFDKYSAHLRKMKVAYYNGFFPGWDNTPRRQNSVAGVCVNRNEENYKLYLTKQLYNTVVEKNPHTDEKILFMNSWNEWGEGCVLEPDNIKGDTILKETKEAMDDIEKYYIEGNIDEENDT